MSALVAMLALLGAGCGGPVCDAVRESAVDEALAVVAEHAACEVDEDCAVVEVDGPRFDVCTRAVAATDVETVEEAFDEATWCDGFGRMCRVTIPPCVAPGEPRCDDGTCI